MRLFVCIRSLADYADFADHTFVKNLLNLPNLRENYGNYLSNHD